MLRARRVPWSCRHHGVDDLQHRIHGDAQRRAIGHPQGESRSDGQGKDLWGYGSRTVRRVGGMGHEWRTCDYSQGSDRSIPCFVMRFGAMPRRWGRSRTELLRPMSGIGSLAQSGPGRPSGGFPQRSLASGAGQARDARPTSSDYAMNDRAACCPLMFPVPFL